MNIDKTQYKQDAKGNLVPLANIKEIDLLRDELVLEIAAKARAVQDDLITFKREAMDDIAAFVQLSADRYDVSVGGKKGNISTTRVLGLRRLQITDEKWQRAMDALSDSLQVHISKPFVRVYRRGEDGEYQLMNLDVAKV